jgi:hypothetical protein
MIVGDQMFPACPSFLASDVSPAGSIFLCIAGGGLTHDRWGPDVSSLPMILVHLMSHQLAQYSCIWDVVGWPMIVGDQMSLA